jgi:hypothetical protein
VAQIADQQDEFVAAVAGDGVVGAQTFAQATGGFPQHGVSGPVTQAIVDPLEVVEIQEDEGEAAVLAPGPGQLGVEPVRQQGAVGQAGEGVVGGLVAQFGLVALALGDVAGDGGVVGQRAGFVPVGQDDLGDGDVVVGVAAQAGLAFPDAVPGGRGQGVPLQVLGAPAGKAVIQPHAFDVGVLAQAEHPPAGPVEIEQAAFGVGGGDKVGGGFQNGGEPGPGLLGAHPVGDVPAGGNEVGDAAVVAGQRGDGLFLVEQAAVLAPVHHGVAEHLAGQQHRPHALEVFGRIAVVLHQGGGTAHRLVGLEAGQALEGRVDVLDAAHGIGDEDAVGGVFHRQGELAQFRLGPVPLPPFPGVLQFAPYDGGQARQVVLHHVVLGAGPHGGHGGLLAEGAGDEDEGQVGVVGADDLQRPVAPEAGHGVVGEDDVPGALGEGGAHGRLVGHPLPAGPEAGGLQVVQQQQGIVFRILGDETVEGNAFGLHRGVPWRVYQSLKTPAGGSAAANRGPTAQPPGRSRRNPPACARSCWRPGRSPAGGPPPRRRR